MRKEAPLAVEVPTPDRDRPGWVKVGVIAAVGFVIGIAWPRVVGVRLGPSAPGESSSAAAGSSSAPSPGRASDAPPATFSAKAQAAAVPAMLGGGAAAPSSSASGAAAAPAPPKIVVAKGSVVSCKASDGTRRTGRDCGPAPGIDPIVFPRVRSVATCAGAEGQTGRLALTVNVDFNTGRFWYDVAKSSSLQNLDAVAACLKTAFHNTAVPGGVPHEHPRYTLAYVATFTAGGANKEDADSKGAQKAKTGRSEKNNDDAAEKAEKAETAEDDAKATAGEASVAFDVALVRDAPKTGQVVARLPRGTKVKLGMMKEGWYAVKFGDDFASDGWLYRGAIGR